MADYCLGSQAEDMVREGDHYTYAPGGVLHAVHSDAVSHDVNSVLAYAICGTPVRAWPEVHFDPRSPHVHVACVEHATS
jgi:hypothetical protein